MAIQNSFIVSTTGRNTIEITSKINNIIRSNTLNSGICHVFCHHTSASLILCENADPDVRRDLETHMNGLVMDGDPRFIHTLEGEDDMSAHIRTILTNPNLSAPITHGRLALGTWQGIFLWEHRYSAQQRKITVTLIG
ncbi:MAG: secondary thiamine-phosphate synthase [Cycloclasticus sp.]|nr:MAG: secondary thiamine-phosphate synthase [Cycloclasticus sp.]